MVMESDIDVNELVACGRIRVIIESEIHHASELVDDIFLASMMML